MLGLAALVATAGLSGAGPAAVVDPARLQSVVARMHQLDQAMSQQANRWIIDPGAKACLLRDASDSANSRIVFIRETGRISMWLTPRADDVAAKVAATQVYQIYFVPMGDDVARTVVNEFGASLWQEPLAKTGLPGIAVQIDPAQMLGKFPAGFAVVLAQSDQILFSDIVRPDIAVSLPELKKCRGGR